MINKLIQLSVVTVFLISCGGGAGNGEMSEPLAYKSNEIAAASPPSQEMQTNTPGNEETIERKIIKTADVSEEVKSFAKARAQLELILKKYEAYISSEKQNNSDYELSSSMEIRVKAESFDSILEEICAIAYRVNSKAVHTNDVTEEFIDIEARLKNKKQVELQYQELLKKANTIDEIINVNEHLRIIREEIEAKEGRLKYLQNQVSLSTINLYQYEKSEQAYRGFGQKLLDGLESGWKGILAFIIGITYLWPILIFVALLWWLIAWYRKKRKNLNK